MSASEGGYVDGGGLENYDAYSMGSVDSDDASFFSSICCSDADDAMADELITEHTYVWCDECGANPIVGIRFKSCNQHNYDICQECLVENHNGDTTHFVVFEKEVTDEDEAEEALVSIGVAGRGLIFHTLPQLMANEDIQDPQSNVDDVSLVLCRDDMERPSPLVQESVRTALARHGRLKKVDIRVFGASASLTDSIVTMAQGLSMNTSVQTISWMWFDLPPKLGLDKEAVKALQNLMLSNTTVRFMSFRNESDVDIQGKSDQDRTDGELQDILFDCLALTHLDTLHFAGEIPVTDDNKKKSWKAMKENPRLKRIKASFENEDYMLELLRKDKKHQWTRQWMATDHQKCWDVLEKAIAECCVDPIYVIYHLLRERPELVI